MISKDYGCPSVRYKKLLAECANRSSRLCTHAWLMWKSAVPSRLRGSLLSTAGATPTLRTIIRSPDIWSIRFAHRVSIDSKLLWLLWHVFDQTRSMGHPVYTQRYVYVDSKNNDYHCKHSYIYIVRFFHNTQYLFHHKS